MTQLSNFQKIIDDFLEQEQYDPKYWTPHEILARLIEELGEVARIINREYGPKLPKPGEEIEELSNEIGDILYGLACLANIEDINLDEAMQSAIHKAKTRDKNRFPRKSD